MAFRGVNWNFTGLLAQARVAGGSRSVRGVSRALALVWESSPGCATASVLLVVVQGVLPVLALYLVKLLVDAVAATLAAPVKTDGLEQIVLLILLAAAVSGASAICSALARPVSETLAQRVSDHVADLLQAKSVEVDFEYFENPKYYDTMHRAQQEAPHRPVSIVNRLILLGHHSVGLLALSGLLLSMYWGIALILLTAALPGIAVGLRRAHKDFDWRRRTTPIERHAWYFNWLLTSDVYAKEVRLFDLGSLFRSRFQEIRRRLRRERVQIAMRYSLAELATETIGILALFGSLGYVAFRAVEGAVTLGGFVMYFQALQRAQDYLRGLSAALAGLYEDNLFLTTFYEFLDLKPQVLEPSQPHPVPRPLRKGIVFDRVSFRYPGATRLALDDVSIAIAPGEHVALVGENGSGKTTLIKLLGRLYDPTSGAIRLDGADLRTLGTAEMRQQISVVFQDYARYHLTAQENIWLGDRGLPLDDLRIRTAAGDAGVHEVISALPHGYETILGKWFEEGEELSIGEWQKVALARALLRNAQIVVLDEPTSAMDASAEADVLRKFYKVAAGRSAIIVSHRLSTVKAVDRIYVLSHGTVSESGTHDQLIARGGRYASLFEAQAGNYR